MMAFLFQNLISRNLRKVKPLAHNTALYKNPEKGKVDPSGVRFTTCLIHEEALELGLLENGWKF